MKNRKLSGVIIIDEQIDYFSLNHNFDKELFRNLGRIPGGKYNSELKCWEFSLAKHRKDVKSVLLQHNVSIEVKKVSADPLRKNSKVNALDETEIKLIEQCRKILEIRNRSNRTVDSYIYYIGRFLVHFRGQDLRSLDTLEIENYIYEIKEKDKLSFSTLNVHISSIKAFYQIIFKIELEKIDISRPKKEKTLPKILTVTEIKNMIEGTRNLKHKVIIATLYSTAMRKDELLSLKLSSIIMETKEILVYGKGKKERIAYISAGLDKLLLEYLKAYKPKEYLFEGPNNSKYSATSVGNVIKNAAKKAGIDRPVTAHMFRHSYATHMIKAGVNPVYIQKILGHSNIQTTMIYTHLADNDLRDLPNPLDNLGL